MVNNTVYEFVGSNLGVAIFFQKKEHEKEVRLDRRLRLPCIYTLYWGFREIPFTLYTYVLTKMLQIGATFIQKLTPEEFGQFQTSKGKSKKLKLDGLFLSKNKFLKKNTFLQLKHYIQRI